MNTRKSEQELKEKTLYALMQYAAEVACDEILEELPQEAPVAFSQEHKEKMEKLFKRYQKRRTPVFYIRRVAVLILIFVTLASVSVMSVEAWRIKFFNFFSKTTQTNTELRYGNEEPVENSYSSGEVTLNYIPEGMRLTEEVKKNTQIILDFTQGETFFRLRVTREDYISNLDTENKDAEEVMIHGFTGVLQSVNGNYALKWCSEEKVYTLSGNLDRETILKIAENIR